MWNKPTRLLEDHARATPMLLPRRERPFRVGRRDGKRLVVGETERTLRPTPPPRPRRRADRPVGACQVLRKDGQVVAANDWKAEVLCDMVMEQCNDIFDLFAKAKYAGAKHPLIVGRSSQRENAEHLGDLEALLTSRAGLSLVARCPTRPTWPSSRRCSWQRGGNVKKRGELPDLRRLRGGAGHGLCQRLRGGQRSALLQIL